MSIRRFSLRATLLAACVVLCAAHAARAQDPATGGTTPAPAPAPAAPAGTQPSKPFSKVTIDINSAGIEQTLPFDIPFYFTGTADQDIKSLQLRLVERSRRNVSPTCAGGIPVSDMTW